jgi:hypothetical protein
MEFSMENFPWNSMGKFYEKNPSNVYEKISWNFPWNSIEFSVEFHGIS